MQPWIPTGGVSIDGSSRGDDAYFDYQGNDITSQFSEQIELGLGGTTLIPKPADFMTDFPVTYPLSSWAQATISDTFVVSADGMVVLKNKDHMIGGGALDAPEMVRVSGGKVAFTGEPKAVSVNGAVVLVQRARWLDEFQLISVETGEALVTYASYDGVYASTFGGQVVSYRTGENSTAVLLPGA